MPIHNPCPQLIAGTIVSRGTMVALPTRSMLAGLRAELGLRPMAEFDPDMPSRVYDSLNEKFFDWEPDKYAARYKQSARRNPGTDEMEWEGLLLLGWRPL